MIYSTKVKLPLIVLDFFKYIITIKGKSKSTAMSYKIDLTMFFRFMKIHRNSTPKTSEFEDIEIDDIDIDFIKTITLKDIFEFFNYLENKGNINSTRSRKVGTLRSFYNYLMTIKAVDTNIAENLETPKIEKKLPVYLELHEAEKLLSVIDGKFKERDYCMITFFLNLGLRLSELTNLKLKDVAKDYIRVLGKGKKERIVYLNEACIKALEDYNFIRSHLECLDTEDYLFLSARAGRLNSRTVQLMLKKYVNTAGINKKCTPHKLRHSAATFMYRYGNVDIRTIQKLLGHENINTTTIYTHVEDEEVRNAIRANPLNIVRKN